MSFKIHVTGRQRFKQCRRKFELSELRHLTSRKVPLKMLEGSAFHAAISIYYTTLALRGKTPETCVEARGYALNELDKFWMTECPEEDRETWDEQRHQEFSESQKLAEFMAKEYITWSIMNDGYKEILAVELPVQVLCWPTLYDVVLNGTLDMVVRLESGQVYIVDYKCTAQYRDDDILSFDDQMASYMFIWNMRFPNTPADGIIYTQMHRKMPTVPEVVDKGTRLSARKIDTTYETVMGVIEANSFNPDDYKDMLEELKQKQWLRRDFVPWSSKRLDETKRWLSWEVRDILDAIAEDKLYPSYSEDCKMCMYAPWCRIEMDGGDIELIEETLYKIDPEARYRREAYVSDVLREENKH